MKRDIKDRQYVVKSPVAKSAADRSPAGDAFAQLAFGVIQLANHLILAGDALAKPSGQTSARWQVLAAAARAEMSVAQIARLLGVARQGVQRLADLLEADDLIQYADNPAHQRAKLLVLTAKGKTVLADIRTRQTVWANELGGILGTKDLQAAGGTVQRMLEALKMQDDKEDQDSRDA